MTCILCIIIAVHATLDLGRLSHAHNPPFHSPPAATPNAAARRRMQRGPLYEGLQYRNAAIPLCPCVLASRGGGMELFLDTAAAALLAQEVDYLTEGQSEPVQVLAFDCFW